MLQIRAEQMACLREVALRRFEGEMVRHCAEFSPRLFEVIGADQMHTAVRRALGRARTYELSRRGPLRLYIELMLLYGSDFDTDPQYRSVRKILGSERGQMAKAQKIYEHIMEYQETVDGPDGERFYESLEQLSHIARSPNYRPSDDPARLIGELTRIFPAKAEYVGEDGLSALIHRGGEEADRFGFETPRSRAMIVAMMYALGHGITSDPMYPWVSGTLRAERFHTPAGRAARLEKRALTWLHHVLAARKGKSS